MRWLRRVHLHLGVFFAPLLIFFVATGWYQTVSTNRNKTSGELGDWKSRLSSVHVDQIYPAESADAYSPALFRGLVVAMSVALLATTGLGVFLAFQVSKKKTLIAVSLSLGLLVPILLLWLGQKHTP